MNHAELFNRAIDKSQSQNLFSAQADETSVTLSLNLNYSVQGVSFVQDVCFKASQTEAGQVYEESVKTYTDKTKTKCSQIPLRLYLSQINCEESPEIMTELNSFFNGMHLEMMKHFSKIQPEESQEVKRGPGRPRKEVVVAEIVVEKRGRGRPRKEVLVLEE